ncbi:MAG: hypothetical protein ACLGHP_00660 [Vicinamibacteria bacterium]
MRPPLLRHWRVDDPGPSVARPALVDGARACLGDEVAIDFPSVADAIARLSLAFGDDPEEPVRAEILLSARQALRGAAVPIDVPVRRTCRACGGRGETWGDPCPTCAGSGHARARQQVTVFVPAGVADGEQFGFSLAHPRGPNTRVAVRVTVT